MSAASLTDALAPGRTRKYGSMSADRRWALRWSYFFLIVFAIFFLTPPVYMLITSLKSSAEISAATNPWWVYHPTLSNYVELLTSSQFLMFFRNSALVSSVVVAITMLISIPAAFALSRMASGVRLHSRPAYSSRIWFRRRSSSSPCSRCSRCSTNTPGSS
jgi:multiple sugar transport system permease protein